MTTTLEPPARTVLRSEAVPPAEAAPPPAERSGWPRVLGPALIGVALLVVWLVAFVYVLSPFAEARQQKILYAQLRSEIAGFTAPSAEPVSTGAPVALLDAPAAQIDHLVVVEGTAAEQLQNGPGHLRSSSLPGQAGISVIMGRSLSYGGVFGGLHLLRPGNVITVTTGQGRYHYRVIDSHTKDADTKVPDTTPAMLTLVTSQGSGWLGALGPSSTLYVDAVIEGTPAPRAGTAPLTDSRELPMHGDHSFGTVLELVLALQLFGAVLAGIAWARNHWSVQLAHVIGIPLVIASLWLLSEVGSRLLPNLM